MFGRYMATFVREAVRVRSLRQRAHDHLRGSRQPRAVSHRRARRWCSRSNMVNALRCAFNRTSIHRGSPDFFEAHDIGSQVYNYSPARQLS